MTDDHPSPACPCDGCAERRDSEARDAAGREQLDLHRVRFTSRMITLPRPTREEQVRSLQERLDRLYKETL